MFLFRDLMFTEISRRNANHVSERGAFVEKCNVSVVPALTALALCRGEERALLSLRRCGSIVSTSSGSAVVTDCHFFSPSQAPPWLAWMV